MQTRFLLLSSFGNLQKYSVGIRTPISRGRFQFFEHSLPKIGECKGFTQPPPLALPPSPPFRNPSRAQPRGSCPQLAPCSGSEYAFSFQFLPWEAGSFVSLRCMHAGWPGIAAEGEGGDPHALPVYGNRNAASFAEGADDHLAV